jgi:hypothetical protein
MKTYDFTAPVPPSPPAPAPRAPAPTATVDGWSAYERWLRRLREQMSEEHAPLPPELMP